MKSFDAIIIGAGIIGVSLAIELRRRGLTVLVLDRGEPGHEASTAGAGMLAASEVRGPDVLRALAHRSAEMYPDFVAQAEASSGHKVDFLREGAICLSEEATPAAPGLTLEELQALEPALAETSLFATFSRENAVDPRTLMPALLEWAKRLDVHIHHASTVTGLLIQGQSAVGVRSAHGEFQAGSVVNCAGAWSAEIGSQVPIPTRPVKGHLLALIAEMSHPLRHVVRGPVYLVPRRDGRIVVGSTLEEVGFDKRVDPAIIQQLHQSAAQLIPALGEARMHQAWTGLRPATPDGFPIMGPTSLRNYFVSTGHFRDGILLAPASAVVLANVMTGTCDVDLSALSPARFA